jgi:hypothetical protein
MTRMLALLYTVAVYLNFTDYYYYRSTRFLVTTSPNLGMGGKDVERQYGMKVMTMIDTTTTARSVIIVLVDTSARASTRCTTCCSQSLSEIKRNDMNYLWEMHVFDCVNIFRPLHGKRILFPC